MATASRVSIIRGEKRRRHRSSGAVVAPLYATAALMAALHLAAWQSPELLQLTFSMLPTALVGLYILITRERDPLSPPFVLLALCFFGVNLRTFSLIMDESAHIEHMLLPGVGIDALPTGVVAISVGLLAWFAGYSIPLRNRTLSSWGSRKRQWSWSRFKLVVAALLLIGLVSLFFYAREMNLGEAILSGRISMKRRLEVEGSEFQATHGYLIWGAKFFDVAYFLALGLAFTFREKIRPKALLVILALFGLATIVPFVASARTVIFNMLLLTMMMRHYLRQRVRSRQVAVFALLALALLAVLANLRETSNAREELSVSASGYLEDLQYTLNRPYFMGVAKTALIVESVPERIDFLYGESFLLWILAPIPRVLWPAKPGVRIGRYVATEIYRRENQSGVPPGIIAEFYLNFGWFGIVAGLLLLGMLVQAFYRALVLVPEPTPHGVLLYSIVALALTLTAMASDFTGTISSLGQYLVPLGLAHWFVTRPRPVS
ncbi:MAG: O-antigen ligase [Deltaproteobacteria bacterium]|nr:O-antigen ligase [Deltaproteobacteria bacterium]